LKLTLEQRIARAERVLKMFVRRGRKYRSDFRTRHREMDEKIDILINCQLDTNEQLNRTEKLLEVFATKTDDTLNRLAASQVKTDEALDRLAASQAKTDEALRRFINSLNKNRNGNSGNEP
jgi:hypothetical protein